jgi:hypothetical protein
LLSIMFDWGTTEDPAVREKSSLLIEHSKGTAPLCSKKHSSSE